CAQRSTAMRAKRRIESSRTLFGPLNGAWFSVTGASLGRSHRFLFGWVAIWFSPAWRSSQRIPNPAGQCHWRQLRIGSPLLGRSTLEKRSALSVEGGQKRRSPSALRTEEGTALRL